jgi:glycosyltransferase involved in cell wall biosynthesis
MFKSQYHRDLYPEVKNYLVVPNGVAVEQFEKEYKKKKYSVGYFSAYYRGLEVLLALWGDIKKQVPQATLDVYYGWGSWVAVEGEDAFYTRMNQKLEVMKDHGVTEHGRISHEELAKVMGQTKVWAYPTEFHEIFCITAIKAQLARCKSVITDVAALKETGGSQATMIETDSIYSDEYSRKKFVDAVVKALKSDEVIDTKEAQQYDWSKVAKHWKEAIDA